MKETKDSTIYVDLILLLKADIRQTSCHCVLSLHAFLGIPSFHLRSSSFNELRSLLNACLPPPTHTHTHTHTERHTHAPCHPDLVIQTRCHTRRARRTCRPCRTCRPDATGGDVRCRMPQVSTNPLQASKCVSPAMGACGKPLGGVCSVFAHSLERPLGIESVTCLPAPRSLEKRRNTALHGVYCTCKEQKLYTPQHNHGPVENGLLDDHCPLQTGGFHDHDCFKECMCQSCAVWSLDSLDIPIDGLLLCSCGHVILGILLSTSISWVRD